MDKKTISNWLSKLTITQYKKISREIIDECQISRATLWNWQSGKSEPLEIYRRIINRIAEDNNLEKPFISL